MPSLLNRALSLLAASGLTALALGRPATEDDEPPLQLVLEVAGQSVDAQLGQPFEVEIEGRAVPMKIVAKPTRHFDAAEVRFDYPRHLAFEVDRSQASLTTWTLDGSDCVIMVQQYAQDDLEALQRHLVEAIASQLERFGVEREAVTLELAHQTLEGTRLSYKVSGQRVQQDILGVETPSGCVVLIIQDSLLDDGTTTAETREAIKLLQQSFAVTS